MKQIKAFFFFEGPTLTIFLVQLEIFSLNEAHASLKVNPLEILTI